MLDQVAPGATVQVLDHGAELAGFIASLARCIELPEGDRATVEALALAITKFADELAEMLDEQARRLSDGHPTKEKSK